MKIITFGEIMLRLQPPSYKRILQTNSYDATYGGGEANVAVSLAQFGENACFVTALPNNPIGIACRNELRRWGVDVS
ncbi:MAG: PfkB family carbohydrate kinase, partial [Clostridia bacterium]